MATSPQQSSRFSFSLWTMLVFVTIVACTIQAMTVYGPIVGIVVAMVLVSFWLRFRGAHMIITPPRWIYLVGAALMALVGVFSFVTFVQTIDPRQGLMLASAACGLSYAPRLEESRR